jgi:hypothetical protein
MNIGCLKIMSTQEIIMQITLRLFLNLLKSLLFVCCPVCVLCNLYPCLLLQFLLANGGTKGPRGGGCNNVVLLE